VFLKGLSSVKALNISFFINELALKRSLLGQGCKKKFFIKELALKNPFSAKAPKRSLL